MLIHEILAQEKTDTIVGLARVVAEHHQYLLGELPCFCPGTPCDVQYLDTQLSHVGVYRKMFFDPQRFAYPFLTKLNIPRPLARVDGSMQVTVNMDFLFSIPSSMAN